MARLRVWRGGGNRGQLGSFCPWRTLPALPALLQETQNTIKVSTGAHEVPANETSVPAACKLTSGSHDAGRCPQCGRKEIHPRLTHQGAT